MFTAIKDFIAGFIDGLRADPQAADEDGPEFEFNVVDLDEFLAALMDDDEEGELAAMSASVTLH